VICAPVLPGITDDPADLESLVKAAANAKAKYVYANPLFLKPCAAKIFLPFVEEHFPHLLRAYQQRYGKDAYVSPAYRKRISELMNKFARKYGLPDGEERRRRREVQSPSATAEQLQLF
jgi:DNA repair photolyase